MKPWNAIRLKLSLDRAKFYSARLNEKNNATLILLRALKGAKERTTDLFDVYSDMRALWSNWEQQRKQLEQQKRKELMDHVYQDWQYLKTCYSEKNCDAISIADRSDDMLNCMKKVAEMNAPLNYTESLYLDKAFKYVVYARWGAFKR